jgi:signal peptidase I
VSTSETTREFPVPPSDGVASGPPPEPPQQPPAPPGRRGPFNDHVKPWIELALVVVLAFAAAWTIQAYVVKPFRIPSESMEPTLDVGDRVLVLRFWYRVRDIERGDVIVFHPPTQADDAVVGGPNDVAPDSDVLDGETSFIKRVIGLPGEWIGGRNGSVWICQQEPPRRGQPGPGCRELDEPYIQGPQERFRFRQVPPGRYFVMGDNRDNSEDSRIIGTVPERAVIGRAVVRYWPPQRIGGLD